MAIGSAYPFKGESKLKVEVKGRDSITGLPKAVIVNAAEIRKAMQEPLARIIDAIKSTLDITPPELMADICERGIIISGGTSLLRGIDLLIRDELNIPVTVVENLLLLQLVRSGC